MSKKKITQKQADRIFSEVVRDLYYQFQSSVQVIREKIFLKNENETVESIEFLIGMIETRLLLELQVMSAEEKNKNAKKKTKRTLVG